MNNVELMNLVSSFIPRNSKVVNVNLKKDMFRGKGTGEIIIEYIFRAGEYTMVLANDLGEWYVKEVYDCFESNDQWARGEQQYIKTQTTTLKPPIKTAPINELIGEGSSIKGKYLSTTETTNIDPKNYMGIGSKNYMGLNGKVLTCIEGNNIKEKNKPTKACIVEKTVTLNGNSVKEQSLVVEAINKTFTDEVKLNKVGINPTISLFNITGDGLSDILISMELNATGAHCIYYVYSYVNGKLTKIFDSMEFIKNTKYEINYLDNYRVKVQGGIMDYDYFIDIKQKGEQYLNELYDGCKLKKPTKGTVSAIEKLCPIVMNNNNNNKVFQLHLMSNILGTNANDKLAGIVYVIEWKGKGFDVIKQKVDIMGMALGNSKKTNYYIPVIE